MSVYSTRLESLLHLQQHLQQPQHLQRLPQQFLLPLLHQLLHLQRLLKQQLEQPRQQ